MEILFENKYTRNKEWAKDIYAYFSFRRPLRVVLSIVFAIYLIIGVYNSSVTGVLEPYLIFVPLVWYAAIVLSYFINSNIVIKRDIELSGKPIEVVVTVTDDIIKQLQSTGSEYKLDYYDIKKVVRTKRYIYLCSKTNMFYSLKKDSFSVGNAEDFLSFLKSKGIKVK